MDPTSENDIPQHAFRQSLIINLFGSIVEPPRPTDAINMDIHVDNVCKYTYTAYLLYKDIAMISIVHKLL